MKIHFFLATSNTYGTKILYQTVIVRPIRAPEIIDNYLFTGKIVEIGKDFVLKCDAFGDPEPTIGKLLNSSYLFIYKH